MRMKYLNSLDWRNTKPVVTVADARKRKKLERKKRKAGRRAQ